MKPSSTEQQAPAQQALPPDLPAADVRPARFDLPLRAVVDGLGWSDPEVERRIRVAIERGRAQGRAEGYAAGWAQGRRAAAEREQAQARQRAAREEQQRAADRERVDAVVAALTRTVHDLDRTLATAWQELGDALLDGALALARAALARELTTLQAPVVDAVRTALHALAEPQDAVVRLNPQDAAEVEAVLRSLGSAAPKLAIAADPQVPPGEVQARTPTQRLRLSLPAALEAAQEVLRG